MNILEESQLLKQSKDQLVEVLQNHGFAVTADTPLADVAKYMKWDGGLLDLRVATLRKTNGEYNAYSQEEWEAMSASEKASLVKLGIQIRAERQQFIISKDCPFRLRHHIHALGSDFVGRAQPLQLWRGYHRTD